jgi:hypothetical protein
MLQRPYRAYGASSWRKSDETASKAFDLAMKEDRVPPRSPLALNGLDQSTSKRELLAENDKSKTTRGDHDRHQSQKRKAPERPKSAAKVPNTKTPKKNWRSRYLSAQKRLRGELSSSQSDDSSETLAFQSDATWSPKSSNQLLEEGENHMHSESFDYLIQGMLDNNGVSLRCLSACSLAELCIKSSFHMFIRASDLSSKIFDALHDADEDQSLALCAATLFFILSQDGMSLDVDKNAIELLCKLLGHTTNVDDQNEGGEFMHLQQRLRCICQDSSLHGLQFINLDNMMAADLAREAMMSFSASDASKSVLDEIRVFGGLDNIIQTSMSVGTHCFI